jgi:hypothetical protein
MDESALARDDVCKGGARVGIAIRSDFWVHRQQGGGAMLNGMRREGRGGGRHCLDQKLTVVLVLSIGVKNAV